MKRFSLLLFSVLMTLSSLAQGWPSDYKGVMLQGFFWDSYDDTQWTVLEKQADELSSYFSLIWVPQSGSTLGGGNSMGYLPWQYFTQRSSFGSEAELRSMISTFKKKGLGTIADVVVNHHETNGWFDMPQETYNGVTYQLLPSDIVKNDDDGATATQAAKEGVSLSSNDDEGEGWSGARDLDHKSANVQKIVTAYVKYLKDDLGYSGFRYDMVKGFNGSHVADYNDAAGVEYSVGECWDSNSTIINWINATGKKSAAFDFQFRYNVRDAINQNKWLLLHSTNNLMSREDYRRYAVTFVENHDTEYRSASYQQDPIKRDTLAANAYLLTMPGTPCVFLTHWKAWKQEIKNMIDLRHAAGISNTSTFRVVATGRNDYFAVATKGDACELLVVVGATSQMSDLSSEWVAVTSGYHYKYFLPKTAEMVWADKASGTYEGTVSITLTAASASSADIVYTTDGSTPSASNGTVVSSGETLRFADDVTLTFGLLKDGAVSAVQQRVYTMKKPFEKRTIRVYVNADEAGTAWSAAKSSATTPTINFWTWGGDGSHAPAKTSWPGDAVTATESVDGETWFYQDYTINSDDDYVSFVWSVGSGSPQTVDVPRVSRTSFFKISADSESGKNIVNKSDNPAAIADVTTYAPALPSGVYTLDGRKVATDVSSASLRPGLYIVDGKKVIVR